MIKEELYITNENGERYSLDLPSPSGITLKWVSNLFSDISKLTCSYSYTFKLPMTANNRRILDIVDDIRHDSSFARVTVDAEFLINGVCLCPKANLYVSEVTSSSISCVMTWKVLKAFEEMKDNSISLSELPSIGTFTWKTGDEELIYGFPTRNTKNTENILYPNYDAGLPYEAGTPPKPVVPVYRLLQLINEYYGTKIVLGHEISHGMGLLPKADFNNKDYYGKYVYDDYLAYGVLPITGIGVSSNTQSRYTITEIKSMLSDSEFALEFRCGYKILYGYYEKWVVTSTNQGTQDSISVWEYIRDYDLSNWHRYGDLCEFSFYDNKYIKNTGFNHSRAYAGQSEDEIRYGYSKGSGDTNYYTHWDVYYCKGQYKVIDKVKNVNLPGAKVLFTCSIECELRGEAEVRVSKADIKAGKAELKDYWWIYILQVKQGEDDEEASIETYSDESDDWMGLRSISREETSTEYIYKFDFGVMYDVRKLTIDAADEDEVGLCFWSGTYEEGWSTTVKDDDSGEERVSETGIKYTNTATFSYLRIASITPKVEFEGLPAEMDIIENLPDISCFDFVKNLFFMNGALPRVEKDGETISAMYYNQLRDRVVSGECLDWSKKMLSAMDETPSSTKTYNSNFGRANYFLMAKNEKDATEDEKKEELELYGDGYGQIDIDDKRLEDEKTMFTSAFYPGLRKDISYPNLLTGRTIKVWDGEKNVQSDVNPLLGYLNYRALDSTIEDISNVSARPMIKTYGVDFKHIRMNAFEPFDNMDEFYGYLKAILENYTIIKEKFILNEFDLANFDESVPIYLHKYNCCFAVSTIQRDKSGVSTVELVKLPYVKATYPTPEENEGEAVKYTYSLITEAIEFSLSLERDYTSAPCPISYERYTDNAYTIWTTSSNKVYIPTTGGFRGDGPTNYISRIVYPYEADKIKGDSYDITYNVPKNIEYEISKVIGIDVDYTKTLWAKIRVYYDDVRCEPGTHTLTFTKDDFGKYHIFKFIFDIKNADGEKIEEVHKKLYYFVSSVDQSVITDDFGDEHENDDGIKINDVEIKGDDILAVGIPRKYTLSYTPNYAEVGAESIKVSLPTSELAVVDVSDVSIDSFVLTLQSLTLVGVSTIMPMVINIEVTLEDKTTFTKTKRIGLAQPQLHLRKGRNSTELDFEALNGIGSATYYPCVWPYGEWCVLNSVSIAETNENVSLTQTDENGFTLAVSNIKEDTIISVSVVAEYEGVTVSRVFTITVSRVNSVKVLDDAGLLIVDRNGRFYTSDEWKASGNENDDADGVAVSDGTHRFIVSKKNVLAGEHTTGYGTLISGLVTTTDETTACADYAGKAGSDTMVSALADSFVHDIRSQSRFPSGKEAYCGALGEWKIIGDKRGKINDLMNVIGGDELFYYSNWCDYWTVTQCNEYCMWVAHFGANVTYEYLYKDRKNYVRALAEIPENTTLIENGYMSIIGDESFKATNGSGEASYEISYGPSGVTISEVTMTSSNDAIVLTKVSDSQFKLSVSGMFIEEKTTVTVKARLNGLMRKATKTITVTGEVVIDYDKLDNAKSLILCKDYSLYTSDEWKASGKNKSDVEGIVVSDGTHRLVIALDDLGKYYFGGMNKVIDGWSYDTKAFNGEANTKVIANAVTSSDKYFTSEPYSAAALAMEYKFPNGKSGFIASMAEWSLVDDNYFLVEELLSAVGGTSLIKTGSFTYWCSTSAGIGDDARVVIYHSYKRYDDVNDDEEIIHCFDTWYRSYLLYVRPFRNL